MRKLKKVSLDNTPCEICEVETYGDIVELWVWCKTYADFLKLLDTMLNKGLVPLALALLNGKTIPLDTISLDKNTIEELGNRNMNLPRKIKAEIACKKLFTTLIRKLIRNKTPFKINIQENTIEIRFNKEPINTQTLFDIGARILKPKTIPQKIKTRIFSRTHIN